MIGEFGNLQFWKFWDIYEIHNLYKFFRTILILFLFFQKCYMEVLFSIKKNHQNKQAEKLCVTQNDELQYLYMSYISALEKTKVQSGPRTVLEEHQM